jgi:hypothetical protein
VLLPNNSWCEVINSSLVAVWAALSNCSKSNRKARSGFRRKISFTDTDLNLGKPSIVEAPHWLDKPFSFSRLPRLLRLDFACFEKIHHSGTRAQEISQLDFALSFLIGLPITFLTTVKIFDSIRHHDPQIHLSLGWQLVVFLLAWIMPLQVTVFGMAWWTVFREKRSGRVWGIAASLVFMAWALLPLLIPPHFFWSGDVLILGIGFIALIAFAWPVELPVATPQDQISAVSGDGTSTFINKVLPLFMLLIYFRA